MSPERKVVQIECQCGFEIARYEKVGRGRLIKMYLDKILEDHGNLFPETERLEIGQLIFCTSCDKRIATIMMIHGRPSAKMNQGAIRTVKT